MSAVDDFLAVPDKPDYEAIGEKAGLPKGLFPKVVAAESNFKPFAVSPKGAVGASQVEPSTAKQYGKNPWDPQTGAAILADYIKKAGSVEGGLAMYNTGKPDTHSTAAQKYIAAVGYVPEDPKDAFLEGAPKQSPLAQRPPQAPQQQQKPNPAAPPPPKTPPSIMDAINRPADRTVELMQMSSQQTLQAIKDLVQHPGVKTATNAVLNVMGLPFSPVTSAVDAFLGDPAVQLAHQLGAGPGVDPYIRAAAQTVLPVAGARSAMMKEALGAEGQFLAGSLTPNAPPMKPGQSAAVINKALIAHDQQAIARDVKLARDNDTFFALNPEAKKFDEEVYHAGEDPNLKLSPQAAYYKKTYLDPRKKVFDAYVTEAQRLGVKLPDDMVDIDRYMHRQVMKPPEAPEGVLAKVASVVDPNKMLVNNPPTRGFGQHPGILQTPEAGKVTSSLTGEEGAYKIDPQSHIVDIYKNQKVIDKGTIVDMPNGGKAIVTKNGGVWDMSRGTTKEIEQHSPMRYFNSAAASITEAQSQIADVVANARFLQGMKTSPEFLQLAHSPKMPSPEGWRTVNIPGYTGLEDWKFHPKLADVLDDYTGTKQDSNTLMQGINRVVQGSIFLDPVKHILNVDFHAAMQAGLFGGTMRLFDGGVRLLTPGEQTLTRRAIEGVINKDDTYLAYVRESPGLKGANNYIRDYGNRLLAQMGKDPQMLRASQPLAKALGLQSAADFVRAAYRGSNSVLWGVGDMILYRSFLASETEHGGTVAQTAASVGEHIPTYVVPPEVLGSRSFAKLMKNPWFMGFSRYEYNRAASYGNLLRGLVKPQELESRGQTIDQIAALAFHFAVTYPLVNAGIAKLTGNPNASLGWYGPYTYLGAMKEYEEGKKTGPQAFIQTAGRPSAAVETAGELYYGKELWKDAGKSIYNDPATFGKYLASKTYPTAALSKLATPPKGVTREQAARQFLLDFVGIKDPTRQQVAAAQKYAEETLKKRQK